jgi:transposase
VATDVMGVSARAMLRELAAGNTDAEAMAELAKGRLRNKLPELAEALTGIVEPHHRFLLAHQLGLIEYLESEIAALSAEIGQQLERMSTPPEDSDSADGLTWEEAVDLLDTIPGVDKEIARVMLAEMGLNMGQFPEAGDLVSWGGLAPGNHESAGKRYSGRTRKGNRALRSTMTQAAWAAVRTKGTFLKARYHRIAARRGKKRAIVATARAMLESAWYMLSRREPYRELGGDYYDQRQKEHKVDYLTRQLSKLGFTVSLEPLAAAAI